MGTAGLDRAASFIAAQFEQIGLQPVGEAEGYFQNFEVTTATEVGPGTALRVGDRVFDARQDISPVAFSAEGKFAGPVVFAGYGIINEKQKYDDYAGLDVKGKVVLLMRYEPHDEKGNSRFEPHGWSEGAGIAAKAKRAQERGAVALLLVTPPLHHEDERLLGPARQPPSDAPELPVLHVKQTVAEELLKRGGGIELRALQSRIDESMKPASFALSGVEVRGEVDIEQKRAAVKNVVGMLPGVRQDEFIVIGAHYDHLGRGGAGSLTRQRAIHNGADDNASGTTALLMLASRLAAGPTPQRSIIFAAFTGEEEGLFGSSQFVKSPPVPLSNVAAMLNFDMVGRIRPPQALATAPSSMPTSTRSSPAAATRSVAAAPRRETHPTTMSSDPVLHVGGSGTAAVFDGIIRTADARSPLQVRDIGRGGLGPSDHMSFAQRKVPVLFFFSGLHADYHRPSDDADKINYRGIEQVVDFAADVVGQIDNAPKQAYVDASDAFSMRVGMPGATRSGPRVTLGIVPDYSSFAEGGGVRIGGTSAGTPAAAAGLKAGDVLVAMDERKLDTLQDLSDELARSKPGQTVRLRLLRDDRPMEVDVTLTERKD